MAWRNVALPRDYLLPPALASSGASVFLHGGVAPNGTAVDQLWRLDLAAGRWATVRTEGKRPFAPWGHSVLALRGHLFLLGARVTTRSLSAATALQPPIDETDRLPAAELWMLEEADGASSAPTTPLRWQVLATPAPLGRVEHCAAEHAGTMLVMGGATREAGSLLDDVWRFDALSAWSTDAAGRALRAWTRLTGGGAASAGGGDGRGCRCGLGGSDGDGGGDGGRCAGRCAGRWR
jgi:hypothetical protein